MERSNEGEYEAEPPPYVCNLEVTEVQHSAFLEPGAPLTPTAGATAPLVSGLCSPRGPAPRVITRDRSYLSGYNTIAASALGSSRFILGCLIIISQTIATSLYVTFQTGGNINIIAVGVWCGLYFLAGGFIGIASGKDSSICKVTLHLISSAVGLVAFIPCLVIFTTLALLDARNTQSTTCAPCFHQENDNRGCTNMCQFNNVVVLLNTVLLILSGLILLVDIVNTVMCSYSLCASKRPEQRLNTEPTRFISLPHLPSYSETDPALSMTELTSRRSRGIPPPYSAIEAQFNDGLENLSTHM